MSINIKPIVLIVLDGWGHSEEKTHNAIAEAKTPFFNALWAKYPHCLLNASEEHVGLTKGTIGNSEVGHMTIGAGRVIDTDLARISKAIKQGLLSSNPALNGLLNHIKKYNSTLHILGLLSPAGVHSHQDHLHALLLEAKKAGLQKVAIHAITDGRDSPPQSGSKYLQNLEKLLEDVGLGHIATVTGRFYALDRDKNWKRTELAEAALFKSKGKTHQNKKPSQALRELYRLNATDEHLEPLVFLDGQGKSFSVKKNDGIFFFNFRSDRPRQLAKKIIERGEGKNLYFVTMTEYDPSIKSEAAFPPNRPEATLAAEISKAGLTQSHIAETEKYAHVTYFFNGGKQEPEKGESDFLVESRKDVKTHDQKPEMRAKEIADKAIERINNGDDFILINFANADMVGHSANKPAIITAVETVDRELKKVTDAVLAKEGVAIITADHGNAEQNVDSATGEMHTAHTLNQVPFILVPTDAELQATSYKLQANNGSLADVAPTILQLMNLPKPPSMTGKSLIES